MSTAASWTGPVLACSTNVAGRGVDTDVDSSAQLWAASLLCQDDVCVAQYSERAACIHVSHPAHSIVGME